MKAPLAPACFWRVLPPRAASLAALLERGWGWSDTPAWSVLLADPGLLAGLLADPRFPPPDHWTDDFNANDVRDWLSRLPEVPQLEFLEADMATPADVESWRVSRVARWWATPLGLPPWPAAVAGRLTGLGAIILEGPARSRWPGWNGRRLTRHLARRAAWPAWLRDALLTWELATPPASSAAVTLAHLLQAAHGFVVEQRRPDLPLATADIDEAAALASEAPPASTRTSMARCLNLALHHLTATIEPAHDLEAENELLRETLAHQRRSVAEHIQHEKLMGLAEFAAGASHEINNPLTVISTQAQLLLRGEEDLERAKALQRIIAQTKRVHALLRDVLIFARPPELRPRPTAIADMIERLAGTLAPAAAERQVTVHWPTVERKLRWPCDPTHLETALLCLLRNAIDAAPTQGNVRLEVAAQSRQTLTLVVVDDGPGVAAADAALIFDPFFSNRPAGRGAGLGLSKAWRLVDQHGGQLALAPLPGQPARFVITLPWRPLAGGRATASRRAVGRSSRRASA